jgi:hypothetical protein
VSPDDAHPLGPIIPHPSQQHAEHLAATSAVGRFHENIDAGSVASLLRLRGEQHSEVVAQPKLSPGRRDQDPTWNQSLSLFRFSDPKAAE